MPKRFSSSWSSIVVSSIDSEADPSRAEVFADQTIIEPHSISQAELNVLVRNLDLTTEKS